VKYLQSLFKHHQLCWGSCPAKEKFSSLTFTFTELNPFLSTSGSIQTTNLCSVLCPSNNLNSPNPSIKFCFPNTNQTINTARLKSTMSLRAYVDEWLCIMYKLVSLHLLPSSNKTAHNNSGLHRPKDQSAPLLHP
jgi:hypothetical protein